MKLHPPKVNVHPPGVKLHLPKVTLHLPQVNVHLPQVSVHLPPGMRHFSLVTGQFTEKQREMPVRRAVLAHFSASFRYLKAGSGLLSLDPREKAFWAAGCKRLETLVDEFEALV